MNSCQLAQELAHAWSTYYVCIYMKSVAVHVDSNLLFDQVGFYNLFFYHSTYLFSTYKLLVK